MGLDRRENVEQEPSTVKDESKHETEPEAEGND